MNHPLEENLYALFERQALATPHAIAIVDDGEVTYAMLATRAEEIAHFLTKRGVAAEEAVGVVMGRSWQMVATLLGVLRAGASYVPCEPEHPVDRTAHMFEMAGCTRVLTDRSTVASLYGPAECFAVEEIGAVPALERLPVCAPGGGRRAYVLFTSGSTGRPKGVEVEHRNLVNLLYGTIDLIGFTPSDRYLATSTVTFDISTAELFVPLIAGGSLLLRNRSLLLEPQRLVEEIRRHRVTIAQTGPSLWALILQRSNEFPKLRVAISTGEAIAPELAARLADVADQVWNLYGPTEATVWATGHRLATNAIPACGSAYSFEPIGQAFEHVDTMVVDGMGLAVPDGDRGELWIGGLGVARGYCSNPALTKERFVKGPENRRYYRTGDLVARIDGTLHYFGRNDDQVQIHGVRVEPREIEVAVLHDEAVDQIAATWFDSPSGGRSIGAAIVFKSGHSRSVMELRGQLMRWLPAPMIPTRFAFYESIPISASGKVDRAAIRRSLTADASTPEPIAMTPPRTETEQTLCVNWQTVLGVEGIGLDDHFIVLGGDSLAAFRLILEIEAEFAVEFKPVDIFDLTVREMANRIEELRSPEGMAKLG